VDLALRSILRRIYRKVALVLHLITKFGKGFGYFSTTQGIRAHDTAGLSGATIDGYAQ